ncbi:MAG TPA: hypothetical protein ENJ82_05265 [Bacteroidetes bacterium]|nr:hypothetical protein [Bacteroidota bacterium]
MAVRSQLYQAQGGMNRRKAGEDFHFLQKLIPLGSHSELNTTCVIPSPRPSDRVPFGTGKAIGAYMEAPDLDFPVYSPESFAALRGAFSEVATWYALDKEALKAILESFPKPLRTYWEKLGFVEQVTEFQEYTTTASTFEKRFFRWMNGLKTLQYFHHVRDEMIPNVPLENAAGDIYQKICGNHTHTGLRALLLAYRELDRKGM